MGSIYLCAMPSFFSGMGRLLDFGNTFDAYNGTADGEQADGIGMMLDWEMIRGDFLKAVSDYDPEISAAQTERTTLTAATHS